MSKITYEQFVKQPCQTPDFLRHAKICTALRNCEYLLSYLQKHDLYIPYDGICIRNKSLAEEYCIEPFHGFEEMTKWFEKVGILEMTVHSHFWAGNNNSMNRQNKFRLYPERLVEVMEICYEKLMNSKLIGKVCRTDGETDYRKYTNKFTRENFIWQDEEGYHQKEYDFDEINAWLNRTPYLSTEEIKTTDLYTEHPELFEQITAKKLSSTGTIWFSNKKLKLTQDDKKILQSFYYHKVIEHPAYKESLELIDEINRRSDEYHQVRMPFHVKIVGGDLRFGLKPGCRQYNNLCSEKSEIRDAKLKAEGYQEFDLHSAIFAIARYINKKEFDADWDLKKELISGYDKLQPDYKKEIKLNVLSRCFFCGSLENAYRLYTNRDCKHHMKSILSENIFAKIYDKMHEIIGDTRSFENNIFLYESLLELTVIDKVKKLSKDILNVYDCFYVKDIAIDEMKKIITESLHEKINYMLC